MPTPKYTNAFYCSSCFSGEPVTFMRVNKWCEENHYTRNQVFRLLQKKALLGKKFKGKMYVAWNPDFPRDIL